ncbi:hypothetical protein [Streptomyces glaucus]
MLNRPAAAHAELQALSADLEVKAARRKWNPALHPRDHKGRFIETGGVVRLWGGKLARVVRALPHDRVLVQDQSGPNEFRGRRHTTSAKWVSMVARPDGTAPTDNEDKVREEDERRYRDPRRGNGVARDDDGDPDTPNDPHDADDRGRPIGEDNDPVGPRENDDQDEPTDGKLPVNVHALPNSRHSGGARFADTAAVRQHFLDLAERPGQKPQMAQFLRFVAGDDDPLETTLDGRLLALRDDSTGRWYLTATGTGQRMDGAGDFATSDEALKFAQQLRLSTGGTAMRGGGFDFSDPDLDQVARTWRSPKGENIQATIKRTRQEFDSARTPATPASNGSASETTVSRNTLKPGDRVKVTVGRSDIEWPDSTRDQDKPETVTVEGTVAPTHRAGPGVVGVPLVDATLTGPDGTVMTSNDTALVRRAPSQVAVSGRTDGFTPEEIRADRVRVGDVVARGQFGYVVTDVARYPEGRTFTVRNLGGRGEIDQFGARTGTMLSIVPKARRRPEDVQRDVPSRTQQHSDRNDAKRAAAAILSDWDAASKLAEKQWPDGAPEEFRALAQHMQNVTDAPKGAEGYHQNAEAMRGALAALDELDTDNLDARLTRALHKLEEHLDANADRFEADSRAIRENKRKREAESNPPKPDAPQTSGDTATNEPLKYAWDNPEDLVTLTMPAAVAEHVSEEGTWPMQDPDTRKAIEDATRSRTGTLKVTAPIEVHEMLLEASEVLSGNGSDVEPHEIRGYTNYAKRVGAAAEEIRQRRKEQAANTPSPKTEAPETDDAGEGDEPSPDAPNTEPDRQGDDGTVTLTPDEVSQQLDAIRPEGSKAPSTMDDGEIRDEIVALMERDMAGDLSGADRTRLQVLEAEEARRAGRAPKREEKPKPKQPVEEPGGLFDVDQQDTQQPLVADPNNPLDRPDDAFGTPDMFADAEGRDTSKLREPQMRAPMDIDEGDRFVDADGRTHTAAKKPVRTGRGRVLIADENGKEHLFQPDAEVRVLYPDEDAPEVPAADAPEDDAPAADVPEDETPAADTPETEPPAPDDTDTPSTADAPTDVEPATAPDQVAIDHSGTGTTVRFPTPNGMVTDSEFAVLRKLGFKASRDRTKPRFFYLPSNMTLSRREDKVRRLKEWLDERGVAYQAPEENAEKPELSEEQLQQLEGRYFAPDGTWAVTDFQPGDEVWTGSHWYRVDSVGPKNLRLQSWGPTPYDRVLARRRGGEIRTMLDAPADNGMPRPGATDPKRMRDEEIVEELAHLNSATMPEGNDPASRAVRRQVAARIRALHTTQSERDYARRRAEMDRRDQSRLVRDPARIAAKKGQQIQGRDGAPVGIVYQEKRGKWRFIDRDGHTPTRGGDPRTFPTRAAAITALNKLTDARNARAGEGWKHSAWDDVQPGDTIRLPELGRTENSRGRTVTGWSEPLEVSEVRRGDMGQVSLSGRRGDEDVQIEVSRADATFGAAKPGTVPEQEPSEAGGGLPWQQMTPEDFGQNDTPTPAGDQNESRPTDEYGTPDLIANGASETADTPADETEASAAPVPPPIGEASPEGMDDAEIAAELRALRTYRQQHIVPNGEFPTEPEARAVMFRVSDRVSDLAYEQLDREKAREAERQGTSGASVGAAPDSSNDEESTARMVTDRLPDLPALPKMTGLSRQNKDDVRRVRSDYAKIRESLDGILAGDPPTGDSREDLRRVREQLDYVAGRLRGDHFPDPAEALPVRASLLELGQDLDRALAALPERAPEPQGAGPNGGTLFHPWDLQEGDLVRFDAEDPADPDRSLAPYFGTFHGSAAASGDQGRTLVTYQGLRWNDDRQRWEEEGNQYAVVMPPRGLVERFTEEQWDAWRRPERSGADEAAPDTAEVPAAPIGNTPPVAMTDAEIEAELEALEAWRQRHVVRSGEGPTLPMEEARPIIYSLGDRRGALLEQQRLRDAVKRREAQDAEKAQRRAEAVARAQVGKKNADGTYPVSLDGEQIGTVQKSGSKWMYTHADGTSSGAVLKSKNDAVADLVQLVDFRRYQEEERKKQERARQNTPDGWVLGDRDDLAENDIIRVPRMRKDPDGRPYPEGWGEPVRVRDVERRDDGTTVVSLINLDGSHAGESPLFLRGPDDTFAWASDRTRPEPTPAWRHELRARMADIGDDVASLRRTSEGIDDQERMQRLQELIRRVGDGNSEDLQGDLRRIRDEAAWLEEQFSNPELPFETRRRKSWATDAHRKAQRALDYPDFQQGSTDEGTAADANAPKEGAPETPSTAPKLADEFAEVRQRYGGDMVPASEVRLGDWVHTVSADPVYNEPMHMVGRVIGVTPVLSNGQVRIEVEANVTLNGKDTVRTEFAMIRSTDLVERLPENNPGREDSSDLARRIEGELGRHRAAKVRVPEGWQAVDGSQIQPRSGDRFRIVARRGGGSGPNSGPEHMNVTVERPAEREGYWRVKGQPLSFRPSDIVAIPDGADVRYRDDSAPETGKPNAPQPVNTTPAGPARFSSVGDVQERWRAGELDTPSHPTAVPEERFRSRYIDNPTLEMSEGGRLALVNPSPKNPLALWEILAPGSMEPLGRAYDRDDARAYARILEGLRDENGQPFPWDAPDAASRALTFRGPNGASLGETVARQILDRGEAEGLNRRWRNQAKLYLNREQQLDRYYDAWRAQQEADGYTIPVNVGEAQAGDDITALDPDKADRPVTQRGQLTKPLAAQHLNRTGTWPFTNGTDYNAHISGLTVATDPAREENQTEETPFYWFTFRNTPDRPTAFRRPRPGEDQETTETGTPAAGHQGDDRAARAQTLFSEGMNAVGGESLPEMQELRDRLDRADSAEDRDAELRDIADRMDALAEQYELAGPQGEHAADRFRRAARIARGEQDQDDENQQDDEQQDQNAPENEDERDQDDENQRPRDRDPDGEPDGGGADAPGDGGNGGDGLDTSDDEEDSPDGGDGNDTSDDEEDGPDGGDGNEKEDEGKRRRRRRRDREGGPDLPHLNMPESDIPSAEDDDSGRTPARHRDVDSLRNAWKNGDGLTPAEDTPERRAHLAELADREGLALSPEGGLAMWPERKADGSTAWRFAQARNGTNLPGITLTSDNPEEARELAARFEDLTDRNGDPFDWNRPWGPAGVAAWRDGEGRNLPQALRAVQDDYEQERAGAYTLPEDLTTLDDAELEAAYLRGLGPEDQLRVMAEMDRRDGYVDQKVRDAMSDAPPANAEEAERERQAVRATLSFGDTDVTRPAPAEPGRLRREFDALDEERFQAAMEATGGRFLSPEAEAADIDPREVFSGRRYSNKQAKELASPELNLWLFGDDTTAGNGRLTYAQYRQREADRVLRAEFADIDEARYRAAVEFTNGYLFKRQYKFGGTDFTERELFSGGSLSARDRWKEYASEELLEWFDLNGGRLTFNQYKQQRRDNERNDRDQFEEEQRRAAETGETDTSRSLTADDVDPAPPFDPLTAESADDAAFRYGGADRIREFASRAELRPDGSGGAQAVWLDGRRIGTVSVHTAEPGQEPVWDARPFFGLGNDRASRTQNRDTAVANLVVQALREGPADPANPGDDAWDSVMQRLAVGSRPMPELPESLRDTPEARARYDRLAALVDAFSDGRSPSGDLQEDLAQARDGFAWLRTALADNEEGGRPDVLADLDARASWAGRLLDGFAPDSSRERPRNSDDQPGATDAPSTTPVPDGNAPDPESTDDGSRKPEPEGNPEPIGGQPAHWARVEDLIEGDMVRMDGTTRKGKPLQRAGYVYQGPERVDVTHRGRTTQMWRTWVTENPDGTGAGGNVYTTINATAARAAAPDDVVPGSPTTGAQSTVQTGNMPEQIPADRNGRPLFPGSTVTGVRGIRAQEGTVTGATDTTVSVRWDDDDTEDGVSPASLVVTDGTRPDGWTSDGHQVRPGHVVTDTDGALLGPVDEVDGDSVTISTAQGTTTRSAGDLRVTGEVRDTDPDTQPVTDIDHPAAADLKDGDVVVLDHDGALATVAVTGTRRDGDRITIEYADTTTGEIGEIDMDAAATLSRAKGPDGNAPELGPDNAPDEPEDLTVHEPPRPVDPVTGPTVDPNLTAGDRDIIDDHASGPDDNPDAQQAAVRIAADLPVTPEQAAALAARLRESADPATPEGRAALRAADHLDQAAGRTPPAGFDRPRPSNVAQLGEGDLVAMPGERSSGPLRIYRVVDVVDAPGGIRNLHLEDEDGQRLHRIEHGAMPVWQLPEPRPEAPEPPAQGAGEGGDAAQRMAVQARYLSVGEVVSLPVNGEQRRLLVMEAQRSEDRKTVQLRLVGEDGKFVNATVRAGDTLETVETPDADGPGPVLRQEGSALVPVNELQPGQHLVMGNPSSSGNWYTRRIESVDVGDRWVTVKLAGVGGGPSTTVRYEVLGGVLAESVPVAGQEMPTASWFVRNLDRLRVTQASNDDPAAPEAPDASAPDPAPTLDADAGDTPAASIPDEPSVPIAQIRPGNLRVGDVIDTPVSRTGYQLNGHRRLTIISAPQRNGWWMQLTGMDDDGNVHDFGLHSGRAVNVYDRNRPTPALPPVGEPRNPNPTPQAAADLIVAENIRSLRARIREEAIAGTDPAGDIHALREQIAQRLTHEALQGIRGATQQDGLAALDAAGITGRDRREARQRLRDARQAAHAEEVRAILRTINDLEPLPGESNEDLAARTRDLLRLIPDRDDTQAGRDGDGEVTRTVTADVDDAVNALLQQLQAAGVDPGDAEQIARVLTRQLDRSRQATARRIARRVAAASPEAGRRPGLLARIVALLIRLAKRLALLVQAGVRKIAEKYRSARERLGRLRAFLGRLVRRVRQWPESRRLARLHRAVNLPDADGDSLAARISHWAGLMPEPGRFGQAQRRVTFWRPTTWGQLAAGRLPGRSDRIQWVPDRAADGGPGLTALRHMAALRAAGSDVDQDVTRRLAAVLGDDFGDDPHATLQHADDYVATSERRLVNLQAAQRGATVPDDLEIEIEAARLELATARREYTDLRARYAAAVPDAVVSALADIREVGPGGSAGIVFGPDTTADAERAVRGVQRVLPRSWFAAGEVRRVTAVDGDEGRYESGAQRITVADLADEGLGTAGHALAQHLARHIGDLDAAQRAFWFTRTHTGRPGARRMRPSALDRLLHRQQTQPETGDSLARSIQAMFSGDWYQDDDLRAFLLGLLATR